MFDMDGTLADTIPVVMQALGETFKHFSGREYTVNEIYAMFGPTEEGVIHGRVPDADFEAAVTMYVDRYEALHAAAQPFPGTMELLQELKARGIHIGVVTGKGLRTAEVSMRLMGLAPYIDRMEVGSHDRVIKPEMMRKLLSEWGVPPHEAAYVGDMASDMLHARQAGVLPLAAAWAESATVGENDGAAQVFYSVDELAEWVKDCI